MINEEAMNEGLKVFEEAIRESIEIFMIRNLRHTGIVVNNLDKCLNFYLSIGSEVSEELKLEA